MIQLPGREDRLNENHIGSLAEVADAVCALIAESRRPLFLYGHSMGGKIAHEVACRLQTHATFDDTRLLRGLIVSAAGRPLLQPRQPTYLTANEIMNSVRKYDATPDQFIKDPDLQDIYWNRIVADYQLVAHHRGAHQPKLSCPIDVHFGVDDNGSPEMRKAWVQATSAPVNIHGFPGGHFFPATAIADVCDRINMFVQAHSP